MVRWAMSVAVGRGRWGCLSTTRENGSFLGAKGTTRAEQLAPSAGVVPFWCDRFSAGASHAAADSCILFLSSSCFRRSSTSSSAPWAP